MLTGYPLLVEADATAVFFSRFTTHVKHHIFGLRQPFLSRSAQKLESSRSRLLT